MSIVDEAMKKLNGGSAAGAAPSFPGRAAGLASDIGFVAGPRKRRPVSLLLAVALAGAGLVVYLLLPKEMPQAGRKAQTDAVVAQAASSVVADVPAPAWYDAGWTAARTGNWIEALAQWEGGVRELPKDRMLVASNSYTDLERFSAGLAQHTRQFKAVGVRQRYGGKVLYRVLVLPNGDGARQVLPKVQTLYLRAGVMNASSVQRRLVENSSSPESVRREEPAASQKSLPDKMPAPQQKAAEQSEAASRVAIAVTPAKAVEWEGRAGEVRELLKAENYAEVGKRAQMLTGDFPDRWEAWFWLGTAQLGQGQMEAADASLERAAKLNSKVAQVWVQRAIVAQERGDHAAAVGLLNEARELSPRSPQIYLNLGYSNDALGLVDEANKNYLRFLSLTEGDGAYALQRKSIMEKLESRH